MTSYYWYLVPSICDSFWRQQTPALVLIQATLNMTDNEEEESLSRGTKIVDGNIVVSMEDAADDASQNIVTSRVDLLIK